MPDLLEGEYDLDGYVFGGRRSLQVARGTDVGAVDVSTADVHLPGGPVLPGRDRLGPATWTFELFTNHRGRLSAQLAGAALDEWQALAGAWRRSASSPPGGLSRLSWVFAGRHRSVFGRAGAISSPAPGVLVLQGRVQGSAQFRVLDPVVYDGQVRSLELGLVSVSDGGAVWPVTWPLVWGASSVARQGVVDVKGDAPVPFVVRVLGPAAGTASQVRVAAAGWVLEVDVPVGPGQELVVDTRAMTATVDGVSAAGGLSRRSRLDARLSPGHQEVEFSALDSTATTRAVVQWQDGWWSM